jgi:fatty-acyl-CoA synthase
VRHSHANQVYQAWAMGLMLPLVRSPLLFGLPLFHVGGALTQGLATLATAARSSSSRRRAGASRPR